MSANDPKRTCATEGTQIPSIIYGLLAHALDRRPAVPSRRQTIVRLRDDSIRFSRAILPQTRMLAKLRSATVKLSPTK